MDLSDRLWPFGLVMYWVAKTMNVDIKHSETYIAALQSQCILLEGWRCAAIVTTSFHSFPRTAVVCTAFYMRHSELFALQKEYEAELTFGHRIASKSPF